MQIYHVFNHGMCLQKILAKNVMKRSLNDDYMMPNIYIMSDRSSTSTSFDAPNKNNVIEIKHIRHVTGYNNNINNIMNDPIHQILSIPIII